MNQNHLTHESSATSDVAARGSATPTTYHSLRSFAAALGRAHTSVRKWIERDGFPVRTLPPWSQADLDAVRQWAAETLQPDRNDEDRPPSRHTPHVSQCRYPFLHVGGEGEDGAVASALAMPEPIILPVEAAVIRGERELTAAEARAYVLAVVRHRSLAFVDVECCAPFANLPVPLIHERLNTAAHSAAEVLRDYVADIFTEAAAGIRPDWLQRQRESDHAVEPGADDEAPAEPTILDDLAEFDAAKGGAEK